MIPFLMLFKNGNNLKVILYHNLNPRM